jgi:hypothetical protein
MVASFSRNGLVFGEMVLGLGETIALKTEVFLTAMDIHLKIRRLGSVGLML